MGRRELWWEAEARLALLPASRQSALALRLVDHLLDLAHETGFTHIRLYASSTAVWTRAAVQQRAFSLLRTQHVMLRSEDSVPFPQPPQNTVPLRPLCEGEEPALLEALNRAWADTWNFHPLTLEMLLADLHGQWEGFFIAVAPTDEVHIIGTIHALFDQDARNPDDQPYAWISNLTTDPAWRGQRVGRLLLETGICYLTSKGARSIALGVDGGAIAPMTLYRSAGFDVISTVEIWEDAHVYHQHSASMGLGGQKKIGATSLPHLYTTD